MDTANMLIKNSPLLWSQFHFHIFKTFSNKLLFSKPKLFVVSLAFLCKQVLLYVVKSVKIIFIYHKSQTTRGSAQLT